MTRNKQLILRNQNSTTKMDQSNLHPELENIQQEFRQKAKAIEGELTPEKEKEVLRQVISEKFQAVPQTQTQADEVKKKEEPLPPPTPQQDSKNQYQYAIDSLVNTAFEKGLAKAVQEARGTRNAFLIDAFHDELIDKFYAEIKSRGNG